MISSVRGKTGPFREIPPNAWTAVLVVVVMVVSGCITSSPGTEADEVVQHGGVDTKGEISQSHGSPNDARHPKAKQSARDAGQRQDNETSVYPGDYDFSGPYSRVVTPGPHEILPMQHFLIPGEDHLGEPADIEIGVWMPDVPEAASVPIIADVGPYYGDMLLDGQVPNVIAPGYVENFVPHGYAFAAVSVRGTGQSGGCMDFMGPVEQKDIDRTLTWLGTQDWSNGNVGMIGKSYDGSTPWTAAATGNAHLKTIVPIVGMPSIMDASIRYGHSGLLTYLGGGNHHLYWINSLAPDNGGLKPDRAFCPGIAEGMADGKLGLITAKQSVTGWYGARHWKPEIVQNYGGSVLVAHGLHDHSAHGSIPWVDTLNQSGNPVKHLYYQGAHVHPDQVYRPAEPYMGADPLGRWVRWDWSEILLHWFDRWLKEDPSVDTGPAVQVQDDKLRWRNEEFYPPRDAEPMEWFPTEDGGLGTEPGDPFSVPLLPANTYCEIRPCHEPEVHTCAPHVMDPSDISGFVADFRSGTLDEGLQIAGLPKFHTQITAGGPTGMIGAWLYDVDESGEEKRIGWGSHNLWYAKNPEDPQPLIPGETFEVELEFLPMDAFVPAGHSLHLRVWQCEASLFYQVQPGSPVIVEFGRQAETRLELPLVERDASVFFEPPMPGES